MMRLALNYAAQHVEGALDTIYLVAFPITGNPVSELMVAAYQRLFENNFWGLTNSALEFKALKLKYGEAGLDEALHSRGSMTVGNAMRSLRADGYTGILDKTRIHLFGPAENAGGMATLLSDLSGGRSRPVYLQNHADDFVGSLLGGNPATFDAVPESSFKFLEWLNMFGSSPTTHSCYGRSTSLCKESYGKPATLEVWRK